jgi:glyoxylase-like metal-dependent hydrolase (beta-lactamase superfamily II)
MQRLFSFCIVLTSFAAHAENAETLAERSQASARAVLDRAVGAIGGEEALRSIESVRLQLEGDTWPRLQMPTPEPPFTGGFMRETLLIDFKNNRLRLEQQTHGGGFENHNSIIITAGEGTAFDHRAHTATPIPAGQSNQQQFIQYYRRIPNLILRQAIDRTNSLRSLGRDTFDGRQHDVFTFVMPDTQQVAVYVDSQTQLVSKYELITVDPLTGEDASEIVFGDYTTLGKFRVPQSWNQRLAGDAVSKFKLRTEINPSINDASFAAPIGSFVKVDALPDALKEEVEKLADGVFVLHNVAEQNYNTLAIAMKDHIVVIEAPGSSAGAERALKQIKEAIPGKPIRYVAMTHHHSDHIGGLRSFIAEGAKVITTPANRGIVEAMAAAPQIDRLANNPRKPEFLLIEGGKRVLSDETQRVELIDIGPHPHANEMVIAYLPQQRIVFQGDLFFVSANNAPQGPPQASTVSFAKRIKELNLAIDRIASVHGRTATFAEFQKAVDGAT